MKIKWLAASAFLIISEKGTRVVTDPYANDYQPENPPDIPGEGNFMLSRAAVTEPTDVVTITHAHFDHSDVYPIQGNPDVFRIYTGPEPIEIKGIKFSGVITDHGAHRGLNTVISIDVDNVRILHLGDLGQKFSDRQLEQIGKVDILMTPWDDNDITMPFNVVDEVLEQLKPKAVFPMHHVLIDEFLTSRDNLVKLDTSEVEFKTDTLPSSMQIYLLKAALESGNN